MFRKYVWFSLSVSLCLIISGISFAQDEDFPNLVQNFDFEDPTVNPWTMWVEGGVAVTLGVDDEVFFTGEQSALIDITMKGSGLRVELHQRPFNLKMNTKMTYAVWAKTDEGESRDASLRCNHREDPWTTYGSKDITINDEWAEYYTEFTITTDDDNVGIYVELKDTPEGRAWFDRFRFYEGDYEPEELEEAPKIAVEPHSKMASTWAKIKSAH